jgi:hypothetical protein
VWPEGTSIGEVQDGMQTISRWDSEAEAGIMCMVVFG